MTTWMEPRSYLSSQDKGGELHPATGPGPGLQVDMRGAEMGADLGCVHRVEGASCGVWIPLRGGAENQPLWPTCPQQRGVPDLKVRGNGWDRASGPFETHSILLPRVLLVSDLLGGAGHTLPSWALLDHVLLSSL